MISEDGPDRCQPHRLAEVDDRAREVPSFDQGDAEILLGVGVGRVDRDRLAELSHPGREPSRGDQVEPVVAHQQRVAARADLQGVGHECCRIPPRSGLGPAHRGPGPRPGPGRSRRSPWRRPWAIGRRQRHVPTRRPRARRAAWSPGRRSDRPRASGRTRPGRCRAPAGPRRRAARPESPGDAVARPRPNSPRPPRPTRLPANRGSAGSIGDGR